MGLASSQARLLTLTSRQHAIEYKAQKLEAEKLQLANDSDQVYKDYLTRLDATKIQYRLVQPDGSTVFNNATFSKLKDEGFLFNVNGTICNNLDGVKNALKEQGIINLTAADSYTLLTSLIQEGYVVLMQRNLDASDAYQFDTNTGTLSYTDSIDNSHTWNYTITDEGINSSTTTNKDKINVYNELYKSFGDTSVMTSTKLQEVSDEIGLKKAEAQYEADMSKINKKDARFDTELAQLETERNAIKDEIETLKTVAKDNADRTFKIFS